MNFLAAILGKLPSIVLVLIAASFAISGDYLAKSWSVTHRQLFYFFALIGYMGSGFFYIPVLQKQGLIVSSLLWSILTIVGFLFIGFILFHETLTKVQIAGMLLGVISVVLLSR